MLSLLDRGQYEFAYECHPEIMPAVLSRLRPRYYRHMLLTFVHTGSYREKLIAVAVGIWCSAKGIRWTYQRYHSEWEAQT